MQVQYKNPRRCTRALKSFFSPFAAILRPKKKSVSNRGSRVTKHTGLYYTPAAQSSPPNACITATERHFLFLRKIQDKKKMVKEEVSTKNKKKSFFFLRRLTCSVHRVYLYLSVSTEPRTTHPAQTSYFLSLSYYFFFLFLFLLFFVLFFCFKELTFALYNLRL